MAADGAAIQPVIGEATALEITKRQADGEDLYFIINFKDEEIPLPAVFDGKEDILTGEKVQGGEMLKKYDLRIVSVPSPAVFPESERAARRYPLPNC